MACASTGSSRAPLRISSSSSPWLSEMVSAWTGPLGYVMNKQGLGTLFNPRGQSLVDAAYRSLGYVEAGGSWVR